MNEKEILRGLLKLKGKYIEEQVKTEKKINAINETIKTIQEDDYEDDEEEIKAPKAVEKPLKKEDEIYYFEANEEDDDNELDEALRKDGLKEKKKEKIKEVIERMKK